MKIFGLLVILITSTSAQQMQMSSQSGPWGGSSMASGYGVPGGFQSTYWPAYGFGGLPNYGYPGLMGRFGNLPGMLGGLGGYPALGGYGFPGSVQRQTQGQTMGLGLFG